jgi:hypothetical protein
MTNVPLHHLGIKHCLPWVWRIKHFQLLIATKPLPKLTLVSTKHKYLPIPSRPSTPDWLHNCNFLQRLRSCCKLCYLLSTPGTHKHLCSLKQRSWETTHFEGNIHSEYTIPLVPEVEEQLCNFSFQAFSRLQLLPILNRKLVHSSLLDQIFYSVVHCCVMDNFRYFQDCLDLGPSHGLHLQLSKGSTKSMKSTSKCNMCRTSFPDRKRPPDLYLVLSSDQKICLPWHVSVGRDREGRTAMVRQLR